MFYPITLIDICSLSNVNQKVAIVFGRGVESFAISHTRESNSYMTSCRNGFFLYPDVINLSIKMAKLQHVPFKLYVIHSIDERYERTNTSSKY